MPGVDLQGRSILVTGGAGAIGSHVVDALLTRRPKRVIIFDNLSEGGVWNLESALNDPYVHVEVVRGDIRSNEDLDEAMEGVDYVFHEASVLLLESRAKPQKAIDVNIQGSYNVFQACLRHRVKKVVWASSASVFGEPVSLPVREDHPFNNETFYGATKVACEKIAVAMHHQFGLKHAGLRYYNVYGPRQSPRAAYAQILPRWFARIQNDEPIVIFGDGTQSMDMLYIADAAMANLCAMESQVENDFFNIGTGIETTVKQLAAIAAEVTGFGKPPVFEPHDVNLVKRRRCSTEKAERLIGFKAHTPVAVGLRAFWEWWTRRDGHLNRHTPKD